MLLSIRNVSRYGGLFLIFSYLVTLIVSFGAAGAKTVSVLLLVLWLTGGLLIQRMFRCPRCHKSTLTGKYWTLAPFWTPRECVKCGLDFQTRAFWTAENRHLRSDGLSDAASVTSDRG